MTQKEKSKPAGGAAAGAQKGTKDEGKYFELTGAVEGEVVVRFPPEASGYLHIGHAKAALLNAHYQRLYKGKLVFRFDDTNPEKEKESFEKIIEGDVELLEIKPDRQTSTSDYFDLMLEKAEEMIRNGLAYVDDTPAEQMKIEREQKIESKNRSNSVEKNLQMWKEMIVASEVGQTYCMRAKIDMQSNNGALRDPTIYRCKPQEHPRTGFRYKVYPTYDFACPIVDSVEGITHTLRTSEYMDRDVQYYWFCDAMKLRKPIIAAYSRLNLMNTVLSKRRLTFFVNEGIVDGWDDPRMPTVRGVLRRGLTVEGLKQFIASQGSSKSVVVMEWDKIWSFNRKVIDPSAPRYSAVESQNAVVVQIEGSIPAGTVLTVDLHQKNPKLGTRSLPVGNQLVIDQTDAQLIEPNTVVTFINWGNLLVTKVDKSKEGLVTGITAKLDLDNKNFKKTLKVSWLEQQSSTIPALLIYYDHIIKKPVLGKDDDFKDFMNRNSKFTVPAVVDAALKDLKKGEIIQIQRKGFFICDEAYNAEATIDFTGKPKPVYLISIPDGSTDLNIFPKVVQEWRKANAYVEDPKPVKANAPAVPGKAPVKAVAQTADVSKLSNEIAQLADKLSALKLQFKQTTKQEWTPQQAVAKSASTTAPTGSTNLVADLDGQIRKQGDLVRKLKTEKAPADQVKPAVDKLLALKTEFKKAANVEWKPDFKPPEAAAVPQPAAASTSTSLVVDLDAQIRKQGDLVRTLKSEKAPADQVKPAVEKLLALKTEFKKVANQEWKPDYKPPGDAAAPAAVAPAAAQPSNAVAQLDSQIKQQGDLVRKLKGDKADKAAIDAAVQQLLALKAQYKEASGAEWKPEQAPKAAKPAAPAAPENKKAPKPAKEPKQPKPSAPVNAAGGDSNKALKKQTRLGIETPKSKNYSDWYTEVITKSEMIEYYDVSGCYILRPWSFSIWEQIQKFFDAKIKSIGVNNCYFPIFISKSALETEKTHIADFAPEVAWVTKSGQSELAEPIAIRPTSETVMYPSYAKWVQSHRDLPIQLNQWCNVVRWEFKQPTPFLRTREFLWQEGHSAFATEEETLKEVYTVLDFYSQIYEYLLAIPVIKGRKTEKEKFAGGDITTTCEAYVDVNGRGIQGGTSHFLGQNFSKMFDLSFEDPEKPGEKRYAYQTSWGLSTRTIGAVVMIHGDDKGLVLPPRVAAYQVVIVPCGITATTTEADKAALIAACQDLATKLKTEGEVRVKVDDAEQHSPGWKFNHWELKGVPIRVELGPKDLAKGEFVTVRRDTGAKESHQLAESVSKVTSLLETIQQAMFDRAKKVRDDRLTVTESWATLLEKLNQKFIIMAPFCGEPECEEHIKEDSKKDDVEDASGGPLMGAKSLCIPLAQPKEVAPDARCIHPSCSRKPKFYTLFGRSY